MRVLTGRLLDRQEQWPGVWGLRVSAPDLGAIAPGQYVLVGGHAQLDRLLCAPMIPSHLDPGAGLLDLLYTPRPGAAPRADERWLVDQDVLLVGPGGRSFQIDGRSRRVLAVGEGSACGALLLLARTLVERGLEMTFIGTGDGEAPPMPGALLPPEVEYLLAPEGPDRLLQLVEEVLPWADQLVLALPRASLHPILGLLRRRLLRLRKGFAQALLAPDSLPCGVGACDLCTVATRDGYRRLCRDGLVLDLLTLV